jgi:GGDEF domain-containing protein
LWRESFPEHLEDLQRAGGPLSLVLAGVDGWDRLGDDEARQSLATGIAGTIKESSGREGAEVPFAYRIGEDRFCLLVCAEDDASARLAERLRSTHSSSLECSHWAEEIRRAGGTLSLGVASVADCSDPGEALEMAGRAAALAEKTGNTVVVYEAVSGDPGDGWSGGQEEVTGRGEDF